MTGRESPKRLITEAEHREGLQEDPLVAAMDESLADDPNEAQLTALWERAADSFDTGLDSRNPNEAGMIEAGTPEVRESAGPLSQKHFVAAVGGLALGLALFYGAAWNGREVAPKASAPENEAVTVPVAASVGLQERASKAVDTRVSTASNDELAGALFREAKPASPVRAAAPRPPDELALLQEAQAKLAQAPQQALALTRVHRKHYSRGALRQEREVIAIEALLKLQRRHAARRRSGRFTKMFPESVHLRRIERLFSVHNNGAR